MLQNASCTLFQNCRSYCSSIAICSGGLLVHHMGSARIKVWCICRWSWGNEFILASSVFFRKFFGLLPPVLIFIHITLPSTSLQGFYTVVPFRGYIQSVLSYFLFSLFSSVIRIELFQKLFACSRRVFK